MEKKKVFIFWDNSNIFIGAKAAAMEIKPQDDPYKLRIDFHKLLQLAAAGRPIEYAIAVGSVPPELRHVWNRLESTGIKVELFERGSQSEKEQAVDQALQVHMLRKAFDYNGQAGTAVMLTGDGKGFFDGVGFQADLERMHKKGWNVEILAWDKTCNLRMRERARKIGIFIPLEDFYDSITFTDDYSGSIRHSKPVDLKNRPISAS